MSESDVVGVLGMGARPSALRWGAALNPVKARPAVAAVVVVAIAIASVAVVARVQPSASPAPEPAEIVPASEGLATGLGWYPLETYGGETFRWVNTGAEIVVDRSPAGAPTLRLEVEPGPGAGGRPLLLELRNAAGQRVAGGLVSDRQTITLPLGALPPAGARYRLLVEGGGLPAPGDPRILNFRVFRLGWDGDPTFYDAATLQRLNGEADIGPAGQRASVAQGQLPPDGLFVGYGWYPYENSERVGFRWVANDAEVVVTKPDGLRRTLLLQAEPGPGVGAQPALLKVLDSKGEMVASATIVGRQQARFTLPITAGETVVFRLHVDDGGLPTPNDPRILNFRVFALGWADS